MTTTPPLLGLGVTVTPESEWPEGTPGSPTYQVAALNNDGSRLCVGRGVAALGSWAASRDQLFRRFPDNPMIIWGPGNGPDIAAGWYVPYITNDSPGTASRVPVNPIPWVIHWKHHLAELAHEWVHTPADDVFHHESNTTGFSPSTTSLTTAQEAKFEVSSKIVRRGIGVLFGKALVVESVDPVATPTWPAIVDSINAIIERFCNDCSGRGFKRRMLRYVNETAWAAQYAVAEGGVHYFDPTTNPTSWGVGAAIPTNVPEALAAIPNFQKALMHYEATTGDEDFHELPASA